jgi:CheY-like chemotaxis protein
MFPEAESAPISGKMNARSTIPPAVPVVASEPSHHLLSATRVLVVDDEADAREALVALLERFGAEVRSVASVAEAMIALKTSLPDVLISDLGMPGEDGYALIRQVRLLPAEAGGRLPALAVSGYATDAHRRKVISSGFQRLLEKPVEPAELVAEVARLAGVASPVRAGATRAEDGAPDMPASSLGESELGADAESTRLRQRELLEEWPERLR